MTNRADLLVTLEQDDSLSDLTSSGARLKSWVKGVSIL
jgi:hypothetical protein